MRKWLDEGEFVVGSHSVEDDNGDLTTIVVITNMGRVYNYYVKLDTWA